MDSHPFVAVSDVGAAPRNPKSERPSDCVDDYDLLFQKARLIFTIYPCMQNDVLHCLLAKGVPVTRMSTECLRDDLLRMVLHGDEKSFALKYILLRYSSANSFCKKRKIGSGGFGIMSMRHHGAKLPRWKKLSDWGIVDDVDIAFSTQLVLSLTYLIWKFCNGSIDTLCAWRKLIQIIKLNRKRSHHSHKNHTVQFSSVLLDENLEPRIYDTDVSRPFDQNHICNPQSANQMDPIWILASVGVAKEQIIKSNSSVQCPLVEMLLLPGNSKVTVSRWGLNQMTRYLKRNGTFRRCSSLFIRTETPTEKKTVANGNGKGADNGSSKEVLSYQANDSLNAPAETPMSQSESSISRPDETATVDNSSATPTTTHEPTWYIVSAVAHHMTGVLGLLINYMAMSGELHVYTPNMGCMQVLGSGSVNTANVTLQDVWYVPGLDSNLVSTSQLTKLGYTVSLGPDGCRISKDSEDGALVGLGHFTDDDLCAVDFLNVEPTN